MTKVELSTALREAIELITEGWYVKSNFDWEDFLYKLEGYVTEEIADQYDDPQIKAIQRYARSHKRAITQ
jgi:hypothetical protein